MFIYYIWQHAISGYDTYDSAVVIAESEEQAKSMYPAEPDGKWPTNKWQYDYAGEAWPQDPAQIKARLLGMAVSCNTPQVVCASFNAG